MFALLARFVLIVLGYALACLAASAFLNLLFFGAPDVGAGEARRIALASSLISIPVLALVIPHLAFIPASAAIAAAELLAWRDWLNYALAGGVIGPAAALFPHQSGTPASDPGGLAAIAAAGMLAGIVYWMTAGRGAGGWRARQPPASPEP